MNPLKKLGFVAIKEGRIKLTGLGMKLVAGEIDLGDAFLRCFLKWQIPNMGSREQGNAMYNINPYIATLHLIKTVNEKEESRNGKAKGLSKREFALFVPTLTNYKDINEYATKVLLFRDCQVGLDITSRKAARDAFRLIFAEEFLGTKDPKQIKKLLNNLKDYGDNAIRYFRLTKYFHVRGGGFFIDLEPRRAVEINAILDTYSGEAVPFPDSAAYIDFISDYSQPHLPWESRDKQIEIVENILSENNGYEKQLGLGRTARPLLETLGDDEIAEVIIRLRAQRTDLQERIDNQDSQADENLKQYITQLEAIFDYEDRPILLEKLVTLGLHALNDAIRIKPNYPVGDDNEPTHTAPRGVPDIECYYADFNAICEVTMRTARDQWYNEGQPVMRHLRDFEKKTNSDDKNTYCLFIAPSIHRDTLNTFWMANKYEYEGAAQKIVALTIAQFVKILKALLSLREQGKHFTHLQIQELYEQIMDALRTAPNSNEWQIKTAACVDEWTANITS